MRHGRLDNATLCGATPWANRSTDRVEDVTCKKCLRKIGHALEGRCAHKTLSLIQLGALVNLADEPLGETGALIAVGYGYRRTMEALARRGLARWFPYGGGEGCWKITRAGRARLEEEAT